jgi:hypothetical protein
MKEHLTQQQISEFVAGEKQHEPHIRGCAACRNEAELLNESLALFRQSVKNWSADCEPRAIPRRAAMPRNWGWAIALAACLIAVVTAWQGLAPAPVPARQTISDAELLGQVNRQLSEAVPPSMAPMEWKSEAGK